MKRRVLAGLLTCVMLFGLLPATALADGYEAKNGETAYETLDEAIAAVNTLAGEAAGVIDATRSMEVVSPYGTQSVVLRSEASDSYDAVAMLRVGETVRVLGDSGEYYFVMTQSEAVGCLCSNELSGK